MLMKSKRPVVVVHSLLFLCLLSLLGCKKEAPPVEITDLYPVKMGTKYGYINAQGKVAIPAKFFSVNWFSGNRAIVETAAGRKAMINKKGEIVFQDTTGFMYLEYADGLVRFNKNDKAICFVNSLGEPRFCLGDSILFTETAFSCERLLIRHSGGYFAYLNTNGKEVYHFQRGFPGNYSEDLVRRNFNGRTCYFNLSGARQFCVKGRGENFASGLALIMEKKVIHFIDKNGRKKITKLPYESVTPFVNGFAQVQRNKKIGFINTNGNEVIPTIYTKSLFFSSDLLAVQTVDNQWQFINSQNEPAISQTFEEVAAPGFIGELAYVRRGHRWCYINKKGAVVWKSE